ncbi:MAG: hypothetical protein OHK0057_17860 [Thermoflexibacter sp.]
MEIKLALTIHSATDELKIGIKEEGKIRIPIKKRLILLFKNSKVSEPN